MAARALKFSMLFKVIAAVGAIDDLDIALGGRQHETKLAGRLMAPSEDDAMEIVQESCTDLINKGTHFVAKVNLGTPPQEMELVADTGSDALVVTSCVCIDQHYCPKQKKCFRGTNRSSTFQISTAPGPHNQKAGLGVRMTFGSGTVSAIVASDVAQVAHVKAQMQDGLLLMLDRRELQIPGEFDGILGLGPGAGQKNPQPTIHNLAHGTRQGSLPMGFAPKLFANQAHVERYSICFNDANKPGALHLNAPKFRNPLPAIGTQHWGVGLYGMSVGAKSAEYLFCRGEHMNETQKTPCGAIPDSGTTLMMGPSKQVVSLFDHLCKNWDRCRKAREGHMKNLTGSHAFQTLLYQCGSWMDERNGINELPSVFLTVGSPGKLQMLELTPWAYVVETMQAEYKQSVKHLFGVIPVIVGKPTGKSKKVCVPSFGVQDYNTAANGPVWIMGTPLFYQFHVGFDLTGPSVSFHKEKCGACNETSASFLSSHRQLTSGHHAKAPRPLRLVKGIPRVRHFDTSEPL